MSNYSPLVWAILAFSPAACDTSSNGAQLTDPLAGETAVTAQVSNDLPFLREEEKLARDVYIELGERWGVPVFLNIARSEQVHMDRVKDLLNANGISDPIVDDRVGVFTDSSLASLFAELVALGKTSETNALTVGATVEDLDIKDIAEMIERTDDPDVLAMYESLMCGSRNHMRAFVSQLEMRDVGYDAQYIPQAEVNDIVSSSRERCGRPKNHDEPGLEDRHSVTENS